MSLVFNLPRHLQGAIAALPGVKRVAAVELVRRLPGRRGQPDYRNFFANFAVDAEEYLAMYPEYVLTAGGEAAFLEDRRGCIVGPDTAKEFGWKVGDTFQLESVIPPYRAGPPVRLRGPRDLHGSTR